MTCNPKTDGTSTHHYLRRLLAPGYAKVYLAVHRVLGWPAVVHTPTRREVVQAPGGLEVVVSTGSEPANLAVEVRRGAGMALVHALEDAAKLLRSTLPLPGVVEHLHRQARPRVPHAPSPWRHGTGLALAASVLLGLWPQVLKESDTRPAAVEVVVDVPATTEGTALADARWSNDKSSMDVRKRLVMPDGPLEGQDRPPCGKGYVPINGGCWAELKQRAPDCPEKSVEYRGGCYLPVKGGAPTNTSIDRRRP